MADLAGATKRPPLRSRTVWKAIDPSSMPPTFAVSDAVFYRPKSAKERGRRGRLLSMAETTSHDATTRWNIQWDESGEITKSVSRKRLLPVYHRHHQTPASLSSVLILVTADTCQFRLAAASQVSSLHDHVLELGCSTGETSRILWRYCASWAGFDTGAGMIEAVQARIQQYRNDDDGNTNSLSQAFCVERDALLDPAQAVTDACRYSTTGPTIVFCDIGGNRDAAAVILMLTWILESFPDTCTTIVIKSQEIYQAIQPECDAVGNFSEGDEWFQERLRVAVASTTLPKHALQAPRKLSPADGVTPICRYHNYSKQGCAKGDECPFDHLYCHLCLETGHVAIECSGADLG